MSPSQFANEFGGSRSEANRRFRELAKFGWLAKVREETGGKRRGAKEHFYRATAPAIFDTRDWSKVPRAIRMRHSWTIFEQLAEQVRESLDGGVFDVRTDRHLTWVPLRMDRRGWDQVIELFDSTFRLCLREQSEAKARLRASGEDPAIATAFLAAFESPVPPDGTAVFHTPF